MQVFEHGGVKIEFRELGEIQISPTDAAESGGGELMRRLLRLLRVEAESMSGQHVVVNFRMNRISGRRAERSWETMVNEAVRALRRGVDAETLAVGVREDGEWV